MSTFELNEILINFHFLRTEWFYALIPAIILFAVIKFRQGRGSNWEKIIDPKLLPYLIDEPTGGVRKNPLFLIMLAWALAIIALAGPVWKKTPQPVLERKDALVIIFDLTRSMYATDVKPNRLVRAKRKLRDLLKKREEGVTALIVYAGDAHTVTPLTDDTKTIAEMIPVIAPEIMPAPGSNLAPALALAETLFKDAGMSSGRILILTDEIRDSAQAQSLARQFRYAYPVSILAVGTSDGAPIPGDSFSTERGFLKDRRGNLIIPKVDFAALADFATIAGGRFAKMSLIDNDLDYLLAEQALPSQEEFRELERDFDIWFEEGPWLLFILLPLAALSFRRGWLWSVFLLLYLPTSPAEASIWDDLWQTRDQQASLAMQEGDAAKAAALFENPQWKGAAHYRSDDFEGARNEFLSDSSSDGQFNLANSLAKLGQYQEAIEAYEQALSLNRNNEDASFNKQLVEKLLESKEKEKENQQKNQENKNSEESDQQPDEGEQNQDKQNQDQESNDQQENQQEQDKQSQEKETDEQKEAEQKAKEEQEEQEAKDQQMAEAEPKLLDEEEKQALQQWLRRVPDDPGGLLRRKFKMQYDNTLKKGGNNRNDSSNW